MKADNLNLNELILSKSGVHISLYLKKPDSYFLCKKILQIAIAKCRIQMKGLPAEDIESILYPLVSLAKDPQVLSGFKNNIAIFRKDGFFRIVGLPIDLSFSVSVADSFHVKPLFSFLNQDFEYIFVGLSQNKGYVYKGCKSSFRLVEDVHFLNSKSFASSSFFNSYSSKKSEKKLLLEANLNLIADKIMNIDKKNTHVIFFSGNKQQYAFLNRKLSQKVFYPRYVSQKYLIEDEKRVHDLIRGALDSEMQISKDLALKEITSLTQITQKHSYVSYDLHEIFHASLQGRIKKLMISSSDVIFGKMDKANKQLVIRENDTDHTDDDLLDDIAQNVFEHKGEVLVFPKDQMPNSRALAAIIQGSYDDPRSTQGLFLMKKAE
jgi:hypothetical protein